MDLRNLTNSELWDYIESLEYWINGTEYESPEYWVSLAGMQEAIGEQYRRVME